MEMQSAVLADSDSSAVSYRFHGYSQVTIFKLASVAQLDVPSDWRAGGRGFNPH